MPGIRLPLVNVNLTPVVTSVIAKPISVPQTIQSVTGALQSVQPVINQTGISPIVTGAATLPQPMPLLRPSAAAASALPPPILASLDGSKGSVSRVSYFVQPALPLYRADSAAHIAGLSVVKNAPIVLPGATSARPQIFSAGGSDYKWQDGQLLLGDGQLLVSMQAVGGVSILQIANGPRVYLRKSAVALITNAAGVTRVQSLAGPPKSLIVAPSPPAQPLSLALGREIITAETPLTAAQLSPPDGFARRNTVIIGNGRMAASEIYLPSALKNNRLVSSVLAATGSAEQLIAGSLMKAAAVQVLVRGVEGFAFSTVNAVTGTVLPSVLPPLPVPRPLPSPVPPPTAVPPPQTVATTAAVAAPAIPGLPTAFPAATLAEQASTAGQGSLFPGDQTLQSIRNNLHPPPGSLPPIQPPAPPSTKPGQEKHATPTPPGIPAPHAVSPPSPAAPSQGAPPAAPSARRTVPLPTAAPQTPARSPAPPPSIGFSLRQLPHALAEEIRQHSEITAAIIALIAMLLVMTTHFWRSARIRSAQLAVANRELSVARDRALDASRTKSQFLANISHEIRTPITVVLGTAKMLSDTELSEEQHLMLKALDFSAHSLLDTVGGILDFSKIEAGKTSFEEVPFSPGAALQELSASMAALAAEKHLEFTLNLEESLPARIISDPTRLRQILVNLIGNAIKFTPAGSVSVVASASVIEANRIMLQVRVNDTGVGIRESDRQRIFEPFAQADASTTRQFGGTGLGLTISKRLANLMGGDITFSSTPGEGTEFVLTLPAIVAEPTAPPKFAPSAGAGGAPSPVPARKRILLVDDSPVLRKIVGTQLEKLGYQVDLASNGQEAVSAVSSTQYALVFMDWQMPVMDGLDATRAIRALGPERGGMPIVAMTANAMEGDRTSCLQAGMSDYISKPFSSDQLRSLLDYWLA